jgi:hypothetical protein
MAKFSKKMMGKEVGDAATYAAPHNMSGKAIKMSTNPGKPSDISSTTTMKMSLGNYNNGESQTKTTGIKQRGSGAATKGFTSRGPMA